MIVIVYIDVRKYLLLLLVAAVAGLALYTTHNIYDLSRQVQVLASSLTDQGEEGLADDKDHNNDQPMEALTFLVYGVDAGEWVGDQVREGRGNADTIILVNLYPDSGDIALLSIPRDTLAAIPGHHETKINQAHAYGGSDLLVDTIEDFIGVSIDYHVGFNYPAFRNIINLMGGIEFYVDRDIVFEGFYLEAGKQKLDGHEAFAVIQGRRDPMGDVDRVKRQQRFLETLVAKVNDLPLEKLFFIAVVTWDQVETNLDIMTGVSLANAFSDISEEDLKMKVLPGRFIDIDDVVYWETDPAQNEEVINALFKTYGDGDGEPDAW